MQNFKSMFLNEAFSLFQSLLTHVSRATKSTLNRLGVFTVSSFHAFICARSPSLLNNLLAGRGATKRRPPMLSRSNSGSSRRSFQSSRDEPDKTVKVSLPNDQVNENLSLNLSNLENSERWEKAICATAQNDSTKALLPFIFSHAENAPTMQWWIIFFFYVKNWCINNF